MSAYIRYTPTSLGGGGGGGASLVVGTIDGTTPSANGLVINTGTLYAQSASLTVPGMVNLTTQTFAGQKTFSTGLTGTLTGSASLNVLTSALGNLTDAGTDGIVVTGGTGATVGNVSLAQHVADSTHNGYLSSTDWSTFNNKQPAGTYVTSLTVTTANGISGSFTAGATPALTLALGAITPSTVNGNTITTGTGTLTLSTFTLTVSGTASISGTNTGDVTLGAVGSSANANAASLSGQVLTLQPADGSNPGVVTTAAQTFAGQKTFSTGITATVTGTASGNTTISGQTNHGVVVASGTNAMTSTAAGSSGQPLLSGGASADPAYGTLGTGAGGTGVTSVTTSPTASSFAGWDANKNLSAINFIEGYTTTATAGATTTLAVGSTYQQYFTGSTTQTLVLPVTSTLVLGQSFQIVNNSTGTVTVNSSGSNLVQSLPGGTSAIVVCILTSGTTAASWSVIPTATGNYTVDTFSGDGSTVAFTLTVSPASINNTQVFVSGVYQFKSTYSLSGTTLTFTTAPPTGTSNIQVNSGTSLSIGTPADGTVTYAKTSAALWVAPTIQKFTSGTAQTYTTPTSPRTPLYLKVRMVGGGGGGGGSGTAAGTASTSGGNSTFGTSLLTANGGTGGTNGGDAVAGGTATVSAPAIGSAFTGAAGSGAGSQRTVTTASPTMPGCAGGASPFGGAGAGAGTSSQVGGNAAANTGSGGGGATASPSFNNNSSGTGGAAGGFVDALIPSPSVSYTYTVGTAGTGQAAGTNGTAGGNGAAGYIEVTEYYQ